MAQENVEMIRAAMEAWNRGDWDETLKDAASDFEVDNSTSAGEWRGVHGARTKRNECGKRSLSLGVRTHRSQRLHRGRRGRRGDAPESPFRRA